MKAKVINAWVNKDWEVNSLKLGYAMPLFWKQKFEHDMVQVKVLVEEVEESLIPKGSLK